MWLKKAFTTEHTEQRHRYTQNNDFLDSLMYEVENQQTDGKYYASFSSQLYNAQDNKLKFVGRVEDDLAVGFVPDDGLM